VEPHHRFKAVKYKYHKSYAGEKILAPPCGFAASPTVGPGAAVDTLQTGYPYAQDLNQVLRHQTPHLPQEGSGVSMCPMAPGPPLGEGGLWCHHVSRGSRPASWCRRALASPRFPWHQACLSAGEGFGVTMCPSILDPPPGVRGLWHRHVSRSTRPACDRTTSGGGPSPGST
jgi:hypothetical protein